MTGSKDNPPLTQATAGIVLVAFVSLVLIFVSHRFAAMHSYRDLFFNHWAGYTCCLLALWAVWNLFVTWRASAFRVRCLNAFGISEPELVTDGAAADALIAEFSKKGRSCKDDLVSAETSRLVDQVKGLSEVSILIPMLDAQRRRVTETLNSEFAAVRVLCWSIPLVGLIGTALALGEAVSGFSAFLAAGDHAPEDVRRALALAESNLSAASEPLVLAVLLTAGISALWSLITQKQKEILGGLENVCRAFIVALSRRQTARSEPDDRMGESPSAVASRWEVDSPDVAAIKATLQGVRSEIGELAPALRRLSETLRNSEDAPRAHRASAG